MDANPKRLILGFGFLRHLNSLIQRTRFYIEKTPFKCSVNDLLIGIDIDTYSPMHSHGTRLISSHATKSRGEIDPPDKRTTKMLITQCAKRFKRALNHSLGAYVFPRPRSVLSKHCEVFVLQIVEYWPCGFHDIGIGHHHARRESMGFENGHGHTRLNRQCFIVLEVQ